KIHAQMADGKAYAFAFDDVGHHESLVHDGNPRQAYLTLDPLN
ncbi:beta-1,3-glucanase family protein, partial [Streptomyces afghaniensis]